MFSISMSPSIWSPWALSRSSVVRLIPLRRNETHTACCESREILLVHTYLRRLPLAGGRFLVFFDYGGWNVVMEATFNTPWLAAP